VGLAQLPRRRDPSGRDVEDVARSRSRSRTRLAYTTQTTLSVDDTRQIIDRRAEGALPGHPGPRTTTSATRPRTARTRCANWPRECDLVLVVGSPNSSNSNRLRELAERDGVEAHLIDGADTSTRPGWPAAAGSA
jgi:4-hydroxy-3-methylbut-2-en-1-yl diphosphate reductase